MYKWYVIFNLHGLNNCFSEENAILNDQFVYKEAVTDDNFAFWNSSKAHFQQQQNNVSQRLISKVW